MGLGAHASYADFWLKNFSIDTGVDYNHPALGGGYGKGFKIVGGYDFVGDNYTGAYLFGLIFR